MTDFKKMSDHALAICKLVEDKDHHYGGSWRKRGGPGAYMVMARKWDRIENLAAGSGWDIFKLLHADTGNISDDIDDLIGYLLLIREYCMPKSELTPLPDPTTYEQDSDFQCEGGYGDGTVLYRCRHCRKTLRTDGLQSVRAMHTCQGMRVGS